MLKSRSFGTPKETDLLAALIRSALASGRVLMKHFGRELRISEKLGAGLVTQADLESEEACKRVLRRARPDFGFLTEEANPEPGRSPGRWIIDPLDGTTNFIHGFPMFCVSVAAEWEGELVAGAIYHPILKDLYTAIRGRGAFLNGRAMRVSTNRKLRDSLLSTGFTYRKDECLGAEMEAFARLSGVARAVRRPGSAALDLAYTARGVFDGFWERKLSPWDVAAGTLLVREAGGKVTDFSGKPFRIEKAEILASNGGLHPRLLSTIGSKRRGPGRSTI